MPACASNSMIGPSDLDDLENQGFRIRCRLIFSSVYSQTGGGGAIDCVRRDMKSNGSIKFGCNLQSDDHMQRETRNEAEKNNTAH